MRFFAAQNDVRAVVSSSQPVTEADMSTIESSSDAKNSEWQQAWGSREFVERWATKGNWQAPIREPQIAMVLRTIPVSDPCGDTLPDIGAGCGCVASDGPAGAPQMPCQFVWTLPKLCSRREQSEIHS